MPTAAKYFQVVLDVVKAWYMQSFFDLLVNGQFAIKDQGRQLIRYVTAYCSKPQLQLRGSVHLHYLVWQQRDEDEVFYFETSR
jgi:hypothetical protein